jgi:hypothetical protein
MCTQSAKMSVKSYGHQLSIDTCTLFMSYFMLQRSRHQDMPTFAQSKRCQNNIVSFDQQMRALCWLLNTGTLAEGCALHTHTHEPTAALLWNF